MREDLRREFDDAVQAKESGDLSRSRRILLELHRRAPESVAILAVLADVSWESNLLDEAIEFFRRATILKPESETVSLGLFLCLWESDRTDDAFQEMKRFLSAYESEEYTRLLADLKKAKPRRPH